MAIILLSVTDQNRDQSAVFNTTTTVLHLIAGQNLQDVLLHSMDMSSIDCHPMRYSFPCPCDYSYRTLFILYGQAPASGLHWMSVSFE